MGVTYPFEIPSISLKINYVINIQHRDGNPNKSQWTISEDDEAICFRQSADDLTLQHLQTKKLCWGLHIVEEQVECLGIPARSEPNSDDRLFIAKFVGDHDVDWHGYPANHVANPHDIPTPEILKKWRERGYLNKPTVRKIAKGQRCRL